jgi:dihydroneopterin aldolase
MTNESHAFADEIHIEQLEVFSVIGVLEHERKGLQRLTVTISFWPYKRTRDMADDIEQAVNYSAVAEETKRFAREQPANLIETLADRLAEHLLKTFPIHKVTVEVRKFALQDAKYVSATVTHTASVG